MIASMVWGHLRHSHSQKLVNSPNCQILNEGSPVLILLPKVHHLVNVQAARTLDTKKSMCELSAPN